MKKKILVYIMEASAYFPTHTLSAAIKEGSFCWEADFLRYFRPNSSWQLLRENGVRLLKEGLSVKTEEDRYWEIDKKRRARYKRPPSTKPPSRAFGA